MSETVSIEIQIAEVEKEIRQRQRLYPKWIEAGRLKEDTAATKLWNMQAVAATLQFVRANGDWIRDIYRERQRQANAIALGLDPVEPSAHEPDTEPQRPDPLDELLAAFPGATVVADRQIQLALGEN